MNPPAAKGETPRRRAAKPRARKATNARASANGRTDDRPRSSLREAQKEFTRRRLIDEGRALFESEGYASLTIDDIVAAASMSRATFYLHFRSKVELLIEIRREIRPSMLAYWRELDEALIQNSPEAIRAIIERGLDWFKTYGRIMPAWDEAAMLEESFVEASHGSYEELLDTLEQYFALFPAAELPRARLRVEMLVLQMERLFIRWAIQHAIDVSHADVVDTLTETWCAVLLPIPAARRKRPRRR